VATIRDVAKAAGVSPMTVSHVINDHPHVRPGTRAKVLRAMEELGYRINVAARNLRSGRTGTIGLAVSDVDSPYWAQLAARVVSAARKRGLRVAIEQTGGSREGELDALEMSRTRMYDGLILGTAAMSGADIDKFNVDCPVVTMGERNFQGSIDHVSMANRLFTLGVGAGRVRRR